MSPKWPYLLLTTIYIHVYTVAPRYTPACALGTLIFARGEPISSISQAHIAPRSSYLTHQVPVHAHTERTNRHSSPPTSQNRLGSRFHGRPLGAAAPRSQDNPPRIPPKRGQQLPGCSRYARRALCARYDSVRACSARSSTLGRPQSTLPPARPRCARPSRNRVSPSPTT